MIEAKSKDDGHRIYSKLVTTQKDFTGMIAYAIYKREKIKILNSEGGDVKSFVKLKNNATELKRYKVEAAGMLEDLLQLNLTDEKNKIEQKISDDLASFMISKRRGRWSRFCGWHNSGAGGLVGNIYTIVVSALLVYSFSSEEGWAAAKASALEVVKRLLG